MSKNKSQEGKKDDVRATAPVRVQLPLRLVTDQDAAFLETKEMQEDFLQVCRPCTWCKKKTGSWCDECESSFSEELPNGMVVVGRPLCSTCEDKYDACIVCAEGYTSG